MNIKLHQSQISSLKPQIKITGSKSESNRLLILQSLSKNLNLENLSNSDDSQVMIKALQSSDKVIDIHHAGTAMRFLTAYFSIQEGRAVTLTGSDRMQERPISILVDALKELGAEISYLKNEGYPPLLIKGQKIEKERVTLKANVSSQYISALLLIGGFLPNGLILNLEGKITSIPYIKMTLKLLDEIGIANEFKDNIIKIEPHTHNSTSKTLTVESDWSSASYFYSLVALSNLDTEVTISSYKESSLQGDSCLQDIYKQLGVKTVFNKNSIQLLKVENIDQQTKINLDLSNAPDIAQTIAVTCFGLGIECNLTGLHTLKIKETDRLEALKNELSKLGADINVTVDSLHLKQNSNPIKSGVSIDTYQDHRMAMAFAPLALKQDIIINESEVVSKSYPEFWKNLKQIGIEFSEI